MNVVKNRQKAEKVDATPAFTKSSLSVREVTTEIQSLLADVEETSRRVAAQIDNRYQRLEILLTEADQKIKRMEELEKRLGNATSGAETRMVAPRSLETKAGTRPQPAGEDAAYREVYQLADAGAGSREIAQKLGKQPGEIDLILALRASGKR